MDNIINKLKLTLLFIPLLLFSSCQKQTYNEPFKVIKDDELITATFDEEYQNNEELRINEVKYNNFPLSWIGADGDYQTSAGYFITSSNQYPVNMMVKKLTMSTNVEQNKLTFYIGYFINNEVHVSVAYQVTINNADAIKPWVLFTVGGAVVFLTIAMVFFTRRYKERHKNS